MGRFLVLGVLGRGGMGVVMEAHDAALDRNVALKLLSSSAARRSETRLLREAQALARLSHPNVVQIYDVGELDGQTFIAMELVRGRTLRAWGRERHPWRTVVEVYLQAARGLAAAHDKGLVHRDFKPENCIIDADGRVRVLDFGLARAVAVAEPEASNDEDDDAPHDTEKEPAPSGLLSESLTRTGVLVGTVAYMSFEQLEGQPADALSDQYSFCASLHEALYGVVPYEGHDPAALFSAMLRGARRPPPAGIVVPRRLARALWRGLANEPSQRWPSMHALIAELEALTGARRSRTVAAITLGMGLTAGATMGLTRPAPDPCPDLATALAGTWDADARARVEQAFATHGPAGDTSLRSRVVERIEAYALAWATMTTEACQATFVARRQSEAQLERRTRCLERHRNRLVSTISTLARAENAQGLAQAVVLPFRLPSLDPCGEAELADDDVAPAAASDDERHAALRRTIDEASTLRDAGQLDEANRLAEAAVANARELGDATLLGEALEGLGRAQTESGKLAEAQATLEEAIVAANDAEDDPTVARAWLSLLFVTTVQGSHAEAQHHTLAARAAVERQDDDVLRAWLLNNLGILAAEQRRFDEARERFERALALKRQALGDEHVDVGIAWLNLGTMLSNAQAHAHASEALARAQAIFATTVGTTHPLAVYALGTQCQAEYDLGRTAEAIDLCERTLEHFESTALDPQREGRTRFILADALWSAGRRAEARAMAERAAKLLAPADPKRVEQIQAWLATHPQPTGATP